MPHDCPCRNNLRTAATDLLVQADRLHRRKRTRVNAEVVRRQAIGLALAIAYLNKPSTTEGPPVTADPFTTITPEVPRDGKGRPRIVPVNGGPEVTYTRASTFNGALDNNAGLIKYLTRYTALGIARNPDLAAVAAASKYGDKKLDEVIEAAQDRVGGNEKANWGTALHAFTDPDPSPHVPDAMRPDVDAYRNLMTQLSITQVESERFVVCDELEVAGTFDGIYDVPGLGLVIGDKKTGSLHPVANAIQLAVYANGWYYSVDEDTNGLRERLPAGLSRKWAVIIHIPKGSAEAHLIKVDIEKGWELAQLAKTARHYSSAAGCRELAQPYDPGIDLASQEAIAAINADMLNVAIEEASTIQDIADIKATYADIWTTEHSLLANARWSLITAGVIA